VQVRPPRERPRASPGTAPTHPGPTEAPFVAPPRRAGGRGPPWSPHTPSTPPVFHRRGSAPRSRPCPRSRPHSTGAAARGRSSTARTARGCPATAPQSLVSTRSRSGPAGDHATGRCAGPAPGATARSAPTPRRLPHVVAAPNKCVPYPLEIARTGPSSTWLGRRSGLRSDGLAADAAGAGPGGEQGLQLAKDRVQAQARATAFGSARSRVTNSWAAETRVTWRCQPVKVRPSKWSSPRPVLSSR